VGNTGEQTLTGLISVDNNAQRLRNLCANLPKERLNGKIPTLRPAALLCGTASVWPHIFLAECQRVDSIMLLKIGFTAFFFYMKHNNSFPYASLWVYPISTIKCTCSHCMIQPVLRSLGKVFQFSLKWNFEWLLSKKKIDFLETIWDYFLYSFLQILEVLQSNEPGIALSVREKFKESPFFVLCLRQLNNMSKSCGVLNYWQDKLTQLRACCWKSREKDEIWGISTLKSRELARYVPAI